MTLFNLFSPSSILKKVSFHMLLLFILIIKDFLYIFFTFSKTESILVLCVAMSQNLLSSSDLELL